MERILFTSTEKAKQARQRMSRLIRLRLDELHLTQEQLSEKTGVTLRTVQTWISSEPPNFISERNLKVLERVIDISEEAPLYREAKRSKTRFVSGTMLDFVKMGFSIEDCLTWADALANEWELPPESMLDDAASNDYGSDDIWHALFRANPEAVFFVYDSEQNRVAGYWAALSVSEKFYKRGVRGENVNKSISDGDVGTFAVPGSQHFLYLLDAFVAKAYLEKSEVGVLRAMVWGFTQFLCYLRSSRQFVRQIFTNAAEDRSIHLCVSMNMETIGDGYHQEHRRQNALGKIVPTTVYSIDLTSNPQIFPPIALDPNLLEAYTEEFVS